MNEHKESGTTGVPAARFGVFADTHYADRVYGDRYCRDSRDKLCACMDVFRAERLDCTVCMGDLVDGSGDPDAEVGSVRGMCEAVARFGGPVHWVLGNHDVSLLTKAEFLRLCGSDRPAYYSFDVNGVHFVVLDGNFNADGGDFAPGVNQWDNAWIGERQIEWLAADLARAGRVVSVVFCHENIDHQLYNGELDPHVVRDAAGVRKVLESVGNVAAVIQGHYHPGRIAVQNHVAYVSMRAMALGPGPESNAYAVVEVYDNGRVVVDGRGGQLSHEIGGN